MGMRVIRPDLERWQLDLDGVRSRMYLAPTPRERERWHALWLLCRGMTASASCPGTGPGCSYHRQMGHRLQRGRSGGFDLRADWGFPPVLGEEQQAELKEAVQELPDMSGIELANWNWKVMRQFVSERFGIILSRSACLNYLHRLGFAFKRPKKRLLKADVEKRGGLRGRVRHPVGGGVAYGREDILRRRGPFPCRRRVARQVGAAGRAGLGGLEQPALWREGQLLFGGLLGDRRGGMDGTGGEQQQRNLGRLS